MADGFEDLGDVDRWAAEARAQEAAQARVRKRWLRAQAEEGTSWRGVLTGLVERRAAVTAATVGGHTVAGWLAAIGADFVEIVTGADRRTLLALGAVAWLRPAPVTGRERGRAGLPADDRPPIDGETPDGGAHGAYGESGDSGDSPGEVALVDVLAHAVAHRPRVLVAAPAGTLTGELRAVGVDVVAVEVASSPRGLAYVPVASIYEISFLDSG